MRETAGIPTEITGVVIDNTDRFELDRRNELSGILPVVPCAESVEWRDGKRFESGVSKESVQKWIEEIGIE